MNTPPEPEHEFSELDGALDKIFHALDTAGRNLPADAIREARQYRDAMVQRLIAVLQEVSAEARSGVAPEGGAAFFALFLLVEFQAKEALPAILEAMSMPQDVLSDIFGDAIHSVLPRLLASFAGDRLEVVDQVIRDRGLSEYVRWAAADAYPLLVRDGRLSRLEAVHRLQQHLREAIEHEDVDITGPLICELEQLAPKEAFDDIAEAYRRDLVQTFLITLKDVEKSIAAGEAGFRRNQAYLNPTEIADTIAELETWAAFRKEPPSAEPPRPRVMPPSESRPALEPSRPRADAIFQPLPPLERRADRVGRNEPCPCGSGKKFKKCCGSRRG